MGTTVEHAHFLFKTSDIPLSTLIRRLLTGYVVSFNRRYRRYGSLFQNRFKSIICQEDVYLKELVRYIHLNPLRAKIVPTVSRLNNVIITVFQHVTGIVRIRAERMGMLPSFTIKPAHSWGWRSIWETVCTARCSIPSIKRKGYLKHSEISWNFDHSLNFDRTAYRLACGESGHVLYYLNNLIRQPIVVAMCNRFPSLSPSFTYRFISLVITVPITNIAAITAHI